MWVIAAVAIGWEPASARGPKRTVTSARPSTHGRDIAQAESTPDRQLDARALWDPFVRRPVDITVALTYFRNENNHKESLKSNAGTWTKSYAW